MARKLPGNPQQWAQRGLGTPTKKQPLVGRSTALSAIGISVQVGSQGKHSAMGRIVMYK